MRLNLKRSVARECVLRVACCVKRGPRGRSFGAAGFKLARSPLALLKRAQAAFTLAEALAAMMFMAIVIPTAVHGLQIAALAGEVGQRKAVAGRIANKVLNEMKVENKLQSSGQNGVVVYGGITYQWSLKTELWTQDPTTPMLQAKVMVSFSAQGHPYDVSLCTLIAQSTL